MKAESRPGVHGLVVVAVAGVLTASPAAQGYFNLRVWEPLGLGALALLLVVLRAPAPALRRSGLIAASALLCLLALSAASMLWAESKESAWTEVNRLGVYVALFTLAVVGVRTVRVGRLVMLTVGTGALAAGVWLCVTLLLGSAQHDFLVRRLNAPIGYINGTAGLLSLGLWPWVAGAETLRRPLARALSLAAAALLANLLVLTQSRAVVPASLIATALVVVSVRGRRRRAINLVILAASVAAAAPWTLHVYSAGGSAADVLPPSSSLLRAAGLAMALAALGAGAAKLAVTRWEGRLDREASAVSRQRAKRAALLLAVPVLVSAAVLTGPWIGGKYREFTSLRVTQTSTRFIDAGGYRYDLWRVAWHEFTAHPLGGLGAGNYDTEYYRRRANPDFVTQPHSLELQMAAELGVGGLLAILVFAVSIIWAAGAGRRTLAGADPYIRIAATGTFAAWLSATSVDWLYDIPGLTGMAMLSAALLVRPAVSLGIPTRRASRGLVRAGGVGVVIAVAALAASIGRQFVADHYAQAGIDAIARSPARAIRLFGRALILDPFSVTDRYGLAAAYSREDRYAPARAELRLAACREPHNYVPPALLGDLALRRGDLATAASEYAKAIRLDPHDPALRGSAAAGPAARRRPP